MKRTVGKVRLCVVLLVLNVLFIWGNSLMPAEMSAAFSGWVKHVLAKLLFFISEGTGSGQGLLRKMAHFTEFTCLGVLLAWLYAMLGKPVFVAILSGISVAALDEWIQCFVPGRGPSLFDVALDTSGVVAGVGILLLIRAGHRKKRANELWRKQHEKMDGLTFGNGNGAGDARLQTEKDRCTGGHNGGERQ